MADASEPYDSGSSTESEPFDDPPTLSVDELSEDESEAAVVAADNEPVKPERHNVLDLVPIATEAVPPATHCSKCSKPLLTEVAAALPALGGMEAFDCRCCALRLPDYCFTKTQLAGSEPECRGCRGVATMFDKLVDRTMGLLERQTSGEDVKPVAKAKKTKKRCAVCAFPLMSLGPRQAAENDKLTCSCCDRELPEHFFSSPQRSKQALRRCRGCLGQEPGGKTGDKTFKNWMAKHKDQLQERRSAKHLQAQANKDKQRKPKDHETHAVFRNRVARHMFAVRALQRKRQDNDLRGSTRAAYEEQLAKEQKELEKEAAKLKHENPTVFAEVMSMKVKRVRDKDFDNLEKKQKKKKQKRAEARKRALAGKQTGAADPTVPTGAAENHPPSPIDLTETKAGIMAA